MNKTEFLNDYTNEEERLLVAKILDKLEFTKTKNKIQYTDFFNISEQEIGMKALKKLGFSNFYFFGGKESSERKILVLYPDKLTEEMTRKNDSKTMSIVRIKLPNDLKGEFDHRGYLGACMKIGIERTKIGDISVSRDGADIIVKKEMEDFLEQNLASLTRFKSAEISIEDISKLKETVIAKQEISAVVLSLRLDSIVSILARTSRGKAVDILEQEKVFLNHQVETKPAKQVKVGDVISIRGKGRFEFRAIEGNTKKGRYIIKFDKYI